MFDESFINNLPNNPSLAGKKICDEFKRFHSSLEKSQEPENYEEYLKALAIIQAFSEAHGINFDYPSLVGNIQINIDRIASFFDTIRNVFDKTFTEGTFDQYKKAFERKFGKGFFFELSDGDMKRIQLLVNELREIISATKELDDDHKLRLIKRLEKLQSELHKRVSDLDRFWGLLIDGSIVMKKVGENAKPIIDRIQEIITIIWRVQARAEELPSNIPLELPSGSKEV